MPKDGRQFMIARRERAHGTSLGLRAHRDLLLAAPQRLCPEKPQTGAATERAEPWENQMVGQRAGLSRTDPPSLAEPLMVANFKPGPSFSPCTSCLEVNAFCFEEVAILIWRSNARVLRSREGKGNYEKYLSLGLEIPSSRHEYCLPSVYSYPVPEWA